MEVTLTEWAKRHGLSRQRAAILAKQGRLQVRRISKAVVLVDENAEPMPPPYRKQSRISKPI